MKRKQTLLGAAVLGSVLTVAGCASVSAHSHVDAGGRYQTAGAAPHRQGPLHQGPGPQILQRLPTVMDAARRNEFQKQQPLPPLRRTITDVAAVRRLYMDLRNLPPFPKGAFHCPADFGVSYTLTFREGVHVDLSAKVDGSGCRGILINGKSYAGDSRSGRAFWALLGKTLHLTARQLAGVPGSYTGSR
ncbi:MAG: hypothetical protein ACYCVB_11970 [Bacilli bacterium]